METEIRPSGVLESGTWVGILKGAPVPRALETLGEAADTGVGTLGGDRGLDGLCAGAAIAGALAVAAAQAKVLPLAERAVAAVTGAVPLALGVEARKLVETDLLGRVLRAEDATALSAVMAAVEQAKRCLARGCRACWSGAICLKMFVSTAGLEQFATTRRNPWPIYLGRGCSKASEALRVAWGSMGEGANTGSSTSCRRRLPVRPWRPRWTAATTPWPTATTASPTAGLHRSRMQVGRRARVVGADWTRPDAIQR